MRAQKIKKRTVKKSLKLLRENLSNHKENADRNTTGKCYYDEVPGEMRNKLLETRGKTILVMNWQRAWLNCVSVLVFCGRYH